MADSSYAGDEISLDVIDHVTTNSASKWRKLARKLPIASSIAKCDEAIKQIEKAYPEDLHEQCNAMLVKWSKESTDATVDNLVQCLRSIDQDKLAQGIEHLVKENGNSSEKTKNFVVHLKNSLFVKAHEVREREFTTKVVEKCQDKEDVYDRALMSFCVVIKSFKTGCVKTGLQFFHSSDLKSFLKSYCKTHILTRFLTSKQESCDDGCITVPSLNESYCRKVIEKMKDREDHLDDTVSDNEVDVTRNRDHMLPLHRYKSLTDLNTQEKPKHKRIPRFTRKKSVTMGQLKHLLSEKDETIRYYISENKRLQQGNDLLVQRMKERDMELWELQNIRIEKQYLKELREKHDIEMGGYGQFGEPLYTREAYDSMEGEVLITDFQMDLIKLGSVVVDLNKSLGRGAFGYVYLGTDEDKGNKVAVKQIRGLDDNDADIATTEIKSLFKIPYHKNIVRFLDFHFVRLSFWLVIEYCSAGTLDDFFHSHKPVALSNQLQFMYQVADAIHHLHSQKPQIIHCDLKPQNILLCYEDNKAIIKLTDFGLSKVAPDKSMTSTVAKFTGAAGTPVFMAPELFSQPNYTAAVDIFSLGLVYAVMLQHEEHPNMIPTIGNGKSHAKFPMLYGQLLCMGVTDTIVKEDESDDTQIKALKRIILDSTKKEPKERPNSIKIKERLQLLIDEVPPVEAIAPPDGHDETTHGASKDSEPEDMFDLLRQLMRLGEPFRRQDKATDELMVGDKVKIESDITKAIKLQENNGGWNNKMKAALGKTGVITRKIGKVFKVQCPDGNMWTFNPALLTKVKEGETPKKESLFNRYDIVRVLKDPNKVEALQKGHGGWNEKMKYACGKKGVVNKIDSDGDIFVESVNNDNWTFSPEALEKVEPSTNFENGDLVIIIPDTGKVKRLQAGHGGWLDSMEPFIGSTAVVKEVLKDGDIAVQTKRRSDVYLFNKDCLILLAKKDEVIEAIAERKLAKYAEADNADRDSDNPDVFRRYDIIRVMEDETMVQFLQLEKGLTWEKKMRCILGMKGIVVQVEESGVHIQCVNSLSFTLNPAVLSKMAPEGNAEVGDLVLVPLDLDLVRTLQEASGIWKGEMAGSCGKTGLVKEVLNPHTVKVEVMMHEKSDPIWPFNINALSVVARKAEVKEAQKKRRAAEVIMGSD